MIAVFLVTLFVPSSASFTVGGLNLTASRLVLIVVTVQAIFAMLSGRYGRLTRCDLLVIAYVFWYFLAFLNNHGFSVAFEAGGANAVDVLGPYFIANLYLKRYADIIAAIRLLSVFLVVLAPIMILESFTGFRPLPTFFGSIFGREIEITQGLRFGMVRAWGPFDHAILAGVFAASTLSLFIFGLEKRRRVSALASVFAAIATLSSGALAALSIQMILIWWRRYALFRYRWQSLFVAATCLYLFLEVLSNRTAYEAILGYVTFNPANAYYRIVILDWGWNHNVLQSPFFGNGRSDWIRPEWMHSSSVDNLWLVIAMQSGLPALAALVGAIACVMFRSWKGLVGEARELRIGWLFSMIAICLAAATVHFWNLSYIWLMFMIGVGHVLMVAGRDPEFCEDEEFDEAPEDDLVSG